MAFSKVHHCPGQIKVIEEKTEPPAPKCRCRKMVAIKKATEMVKNGEASWVVTKRTRTVREQPCRFCHGDPDFKKCATCWDHKTEMLPFDEEEYCNDIVLVSRLPADEREKKQSSALAAKTPRVATIEMGHITLAYIEGLKAAQDRIEEYGRLILDARMYAGKARTPMIVQEPENNRDRAEGPRWDYGRKI